MMKLKVMGRGAGVGGGGCNRGQAGYADLSIMKSFCPGYHDGSTPVGLHGKQQASEGRPSSSRLIMRVTVIVRKSHGIDGKTESLPPLFKRGIIT